MLRQGFGEISQKRQLLFGLVGGTAYQQTVTKTYDAMGNKVTEDYPTSLSLEYSYNYINRLSSIYDGSNTIASYGYIGSRMETQTFQSGATQTNTYGGFRNEVTSIHHQTSTPTTSERLDYGYDKNHDRLYERYGGSGSAGDGFAYDKLRRLTNAWMGSTVPESPSGNTYVTKIDYNMDDDGNRTSVVTTAWLGAPGTTNYTTNSLNQYSDVGGTSRTHDDNGNLTDDGTNLYEYDYRNQLVRVKLKSGGATVATYKYDAAGRRVEKDVNGGATQRYIYSGLETIETQDNAGNWKQSFVFRDAIDAVVMLEQADVLDHDGDLNTSETTRSFYHTNALGSVMQITDALQAEVAKYRYNPYGAVTITIGGTPQSSDPLGQPWMYTGRFKDEESGLYYYRARMYDSAKGRFLRRDPLGYGPGPSLYGYAEENPASYRDPLGLEGGKGKPRKPAPKWKFPKRERDFNKAMKRCWLRGRTRKACLDCCHNEAEELADELNGDYKNNVKWCDWKYASHKEDVDRVRKQQRDFSLFLDSLSLVTTISNLLDLRLALKGVSSAGDVLTDAWQASAGTIAITGAQRLVGGTLKIWFERTALYGNLWLECRGDAKATQRSAALALGRALANCLNKCCKKSP